jgi:hypothetical protein
MRVNDKTKSKVIWQIDNNLNKVKGTIYEKELKMMRSKYIYKDIDTEQLVKDVKYLKCIKQL